MAYRRLGRDNKHRRSMLATLTKQVIMNERIQTTDTRAKEVRKCVDKMITLGKRGDLVSRRNALAFLHNDTEVVKQSMSSMISVFTGLVLVGITAYFVFNLLDKNISYNLIILIGIVIYSIVYICLVIYLNKTCEKHFNNISIC